MQRETERSRQAERVKTEILEAAIPLFARGFDSVAVQEIAAAAGYKHSLLMYHFGTKEKLWELAAERMMQRFDEAHRRHFSRRPAPRDDHEKLRRLLLAFVLALRELPAYGQVLLCEGVQPSGRLLWLHRHYFPSAFTETQFEDARLREALGKVTLPRSALVGALLYTVVAAPQIALSAQQEGGEPPDDIYPISDTLAARLVDMMTAFVFAQLTPVPAKRRRR